MSLRFSQDVSSKWPMLWLFQNSYRRTDFENLSKLFPLALLHLCAFGGGGGEAPRGCRTQAVKLSPFTVDEANPPQWYSDLFSQSYVERRGPRGTPEKAYSNSASTNSCCFPIRAALPQPSQWASEKKSFGGNKSREEQTSVRTDWQ